MQAEKSRLVPFIVGRRRRCEAGAENGFKEACVERVRLVRPVDILRRADDDLTADVYKQRIAVSKGIRRETCKRDRQPQ
jgi:hypothetical protein